MSEPGKRRGRAHDAEGAREAIRNAAEEVFAQHGFDGARIDAIAAQSGYNKSLIFHYFGDKLGLYAEVTKRVDQEMNVFLMTLLAPFFEDETVASNADKFRTLLETIIGSVFDFLVARPHLMRIMCWEMAEGWQTYMKILPQFSMEDTVQIEKLLHTAWEAGLLRFNFTPLMQMTMVLQLCVSYLTWIPIYQMLLPGKDISSVAGLTRAREYIVRFVVAGVMKDPGERNPDQLTREEIPRKE